MRKLGAVLLLLVAAFFATTAPSLAQSLRQCAGVDLTGPADGAVLDPGYRANFTWDSEPRGTASREWVSVRVDLDETSFSFEDAKKAKAEPRLYKGFARGRPGVYAWAVIFYDAKGNPICQSEARTYVVAGGGFDSLSGQSSAAAVKAALGRYIIRLSSGDNTFYTGPAHRQVASKDYNDDTDADNWKALGYTGLEIYGSQHNNKIKGSNLSDVIRGGNETCSVNNGFLSGCKAGDEIDGGAGDDEIFGGDETCSVSDSLLSGCKAGDDIKGGDGNDLVHGGNESCSVTNSALAGCDDGDDIEGNGGNDTINGNGGNDDIEGNAGDDIIHGNDGNDDIEGNGGQDQLFGDNGNDFLNGGSGNDTLDGGPDLDTGTGGGGTDTCSNGAFASCP